MALSDECQDVGAPDWSPTPSNEGGPCGAGGLYGAADYGTQAPTIGVICEEGQEAGEPDYFPLPPLDFPPVGEGAVIGYPDYEPLPPLDFPPAGVGALAGYPDYSGELGGVSVGLNASDLELAARLHWPLAHSRFGKVWFYEAPDGTVQHVSFGTGGAGSTAGISQDFANTGQYSFKLHTAGAANSHGNVYREFNKAPGTRLGLGCWVYAAANFDYLSLLMNYYLEGVAHITQLTYRASTGALGYFDSAGMEQSLEAFGTKPLSILGWTLFQYVIDIEEGIYVRANYGGEVVQMGQAYQQGATGADEQDFYWQVQLEDEDDVGVTIYVDDIVLTYDEL